jgi:hypothetical protein
MTPDRIRKSVERLVVEEAARLLGVRDDFLGGNSELR